MRVLIVDDFPTMRRILKNVLRQIHIENTLEAQNGKEALDLLRKEEVDLIICDMLMPEMTGMELLRVCKDDPQISRIPFIMVTAEAQKKAVMDAIKAGVDNYITKPFTADRLQDAIKKTMEKAAT
ncbi:MAG TPA: response regulator [Thermodesulfobacteriota bacterium]|nr:response regulator [Thermodesulfobacteriota bacterium]